MISPGVKNGRKSDCNMVKPELMLHVGASVIIPMPGPHDTRAAVWGNPGQGPSRIEPQGGFLHDFGSVCAKQAKEHRQDGPGQLTIFGRRGC